MNRPKPSKAIKVKRYERYTPKGVSSCTRTIVSELNAREKRNFEEEWSGKRPEWTWDGKCFRPTGRWHDTHAGGTYVTENVQEIVYKRRIMHKQDVCVLDVMSGKSRTLKGATIRDINTEAGRKYGKLKVKGHNIPVCYDDDEWTIYR